LEMGLKSDLEIEIKIKLKDSDKLLRWLEGNAVLEKKIQQTDYYFDPPDRSFIFEGRDDYRDAKEFFRVRFEEEKSEVCYKYWHRDQKTEQSIYADEIEFEICDGKRFLMILEILGFRQTALIEKKRSVWRHQDFEFALDQVKGLGDFVEIEYKGKVSDPLQARQKIFALVEQIGLKHWRETKRGYCAIQWNPGKNHFEEARD
jgi:adenylate cyclase class 2